MKVVRLTQDYIIGDFDCGNKDLNEFLLNDSKKYMDRRLAVTYIIESDGDMVGYFSLSNDKLTVNEVDKSSWRRIKQFFRHEKHRSDYPAVKVGRLAVNKKYQGRDIGSDILNFIKSMFVYNNIDRQQLNLDTLTVQLYYNLNELD